MEQPFKTLKGDLAIRPVFYQSEARIEAHIFIAFLAFRLHATLRQRLPATAPELTPRAVQMIDAHVLTTGGRELTLTRHTEPELALRLLIEKLKLRLPDQPPPRITAEPTQPPVPM